jgi:hypothetical protein
MSKSRENQLKQDHVDKLLDQIKKVESMMQDQLLSPELKKELDKLHQLTHPKQSLPSKVRLFDDKKMDVLPSDVSANKASKKYIK